MKQMKKQKGSKNMEKDINISVRGNSPLMHREDCRIGNGEKTLESMILDVLQDPDFVEYDEDIKKFHIWEEKALRLIVHISELIRDECIDNEGNIMTDRMLVESDVFQGYAAILHALSGWPRQYKPGFTNPSVQMIKEVFGNKEV